MSTFKKFDSWLDSLRAPIWMDVIRIFLGVFLIYKGTVFALNFETFTDNISSIGWTYIAGHLAQYILFVQLLGGLMLILGAYTRSMCLLNIPILVGAIVFNYKRILTPENYMELPMAIVVLVLLIVLFFFGSGRLSLEQIRRDRRRQKHMA